MRPSSIRHTRPAGQSPRVIRRTATVAIAIGAVGLLALSCSQEKSSMASGRTRDTVAAMPDVAQPASAVARVDETPQSVMAAPPAPAQGMSKVAGDAEAFAARQSGAAPTAQMASGLPSAAAVSQPATTGSMIIRTGYAGIEVDSLDA